MAAAELDRLLGDFLALHTRGNVSMTLTVDDRELIERLNATVAHYEQFPLDNTAGATMLNCRAAADRLQSLLSDVERLSEAATKARDKFLHYEDLHRTKCTADGDEKADRNREMADMLTVALTQTEVP